EARRGGHHLPCGAAGCRDSCAASSADPVPERPAPLEDRAPRGSCGATPSSRLARRHTPTEVVDACAVVMPSMRPRRARACSAPSPPPDRAQVKHRFVTSPCPRPPTPSGAGGPPSVKPSGYSTSQLRGETTIAVVAERVRDSTQVGEPHALRAAVFKKLRVEGL